MSVGVDSPRIPKTKKHKISDAERIEKKERKRKRSAIEDISSSKPPHKRQAQSFEETTRPEAQLQVLGPTPTSQTSPFYEQTSSLYLPIAPIGQRHPIRSLCAEHVSPLLLSYYPPFHGVLISYSNPRLSSTAHDKFTAGQKEDAFARSVDEYAASYIWLTAEFLVFRPQPGDVIEGFVNLQSETSIGIVYWNFFNASIERDFLPKSWRWRPAVMSARRTSGKGTPNKAANEDESGKAQKEGQTLTREEHDVGHFQTREGIRIEGRIRFYVKNVDTARSADQEHKFLGIEGTMMKPGEEEATSEAPLLKGDDVVGNGARSKKS